MKKSSIWAIVGLVVVVVILGYFAVANNWFNSGSNAPQPYGNGSSTAQTPTGTNPGGTTGGTGTGGPVISTLTYYCQQGTITAAYTSNSVGLKLSDGRSIGLPQVVSGSGTRYEQGAGTAQDTVFWSTGNNASLTEGGKTTYANCVAGTETPSKVTGMTAYTDNSKTFTLTHPIQFTVVGGEGGYTQNWRQAATSSGIQLVVITIPASFEPKTNFAGATFTVGTSADPSAVKNCLTEANGNPTTKSQVTINGVPFTKLVFTDAGAGNYYETTSYRAVHNNQCYAVEYTIHTSNIANYPPSAGIKAYDKTKVQSVMDGIAKSFAFL